MFRMMPQVLLIVLLINSLLINTCKSQKYIPILHDSILIEGIYKNFEEFKMNNPSILTDVFVLITYSPLNEIDDGNQCYLKRKDSIKIEMKEVWGFSDGKDVYVKQGKGLLAITPLFNKIKYFGMYCYYDVIKEDEVKSTTQDFFGGSTNHNSERGILVGKIIDMRNGKDYYLKNKINGILKKDPELFKEYLSENNNEEKDISYLIKYSEKHIHESF